MGLSDSGRGFFFNYKSAFLAASLVYPTWRPSLVGWRPLLLATRSTIGSPLALCSDLPGRGWKAVFAVSDRPTAGGEKGRGALLYQIRGERVLGCSGSGGVGFKPRGRVTCWVNDRPQHCNRQN